MPPTRKKAEKVSKISKKGKDSDKGSSNNLAAADDDADDGPLEGETPADALRRKGIVTTYALNSKIMHRNVRDISAENLTVTFHGTPLIEEAELTLNYGNRYGFIGRNGTGKSTFMRVIAARSFPIPEGIDIFHLTEEIEASDLTAKEAVMAVDEERAKLEAEAEELNDIIAAEEGGDDADDVMERLNQVYDRLEELDAATAEARASKILLGLGFTPEKQDKKTREFSGGWRMRIALARALFIQPTLLLLDEPTNHLDMEAVVWLEDYLSKWKKILFMVSHSQDFMNNVCTHIVHLHKRRLTYYSGNYDQFVKTRTEKEEEQEKRYKAEQDQIKHMKNYVARFGSGNAKMAKQAQSKEKVLDKMLKSGLTEKVEQDKALDFKFAETQKLSPPVLQCNDISFGYPGCPLLYENVDFGIDMDSRVALVGPNGAGKSTLLKIMTGELIPVSGVVRPHAHLRISKFTQHFVDVLDLSQTPLDYFCSLWANMTREDARKFLGRYGISGPVQTQVMSQLSDGQKSRVVLAKMARENPHILFLDEPTNHLDMESIDSLAKAINGFEGGMVLVSHDMRLISQVAQEIWLVDNHTVAKYVGEISDFKMHLRAQMELDGSNSKGKAPPLKVAPLVPSKGLPAPGTSGRSTHMKIAPPAPPTAASAADWPKAETQEDLILKARLEKAELAIAKQRARQAAEGNAAAPASTADPASTAASAETNAAAPAAAASTSAAAQAQAAGEGEEEESEEAMEARLKQEEKAAAKARRKAEREAAEAQRQREEEERERRRQEKIKETEEAKRILEAEQKAHQEFLAMKAEKEAKRKAEEDAEAARQAEAAAERKAERERRKAERAAQRAARQEAARLAAEKAVLEDLWTQAQQVAFEDALLDFDNSMDKWERWTKIAERVGGDKSKNQCIMRYRYLKEYVAKKKDIDASAALPIF